MSCVLIRSSKLVTCQDVLLGRTERATVICSPGSKTRRPHRHQLCMNQGSVANVRFSSTSLYDFLLHGVLGASQVLLDRVAQALDVSNQALQSIIRHSTPRVDRNPQKTYLNRAYASRRCLEYSQD